MFNPDLTPPQLLAGLGTTLTLERRTIARVIAFLIDIEDTNAHKEAGYPSMRALCMKKYRMSKSEAKNRLAVARLVRRYPQILEALEAETIMFSTVLLLKNMFNDSNVDDLLGKGAGKSKREVQQLIADLNANGGTAGTIRKVPHPENIDAPSNPRLPEEKPTALGFDLEQLKSVVSETCRASIDEAIGLTREDTTGDQLVEAAFKALVEKLRCEQSEARAHASDLRKSTPQTTIQTVTNGTQRDAEHDGWQCAFVNGGVRCKERGWLELTHVTSRADSGEIRVDGLRLLCPTHSKVEAEATTRAATETPPGQVGRLAPRAKKGLAKAKGLVVQTTNGASRPRRSANE